MHMLGILIFMTAAYQHNIARANGFCEPLTPAPNTVPVNEKHPVNTKIRIQCAEGYVRKAGTSNLIRCTEKNGHLYWHTDLPLQCISDPTKPHKKQMPPRHFTSSTTERTEINPTVLGTSMPTTATGHLTLTTTNEVVTTKTRRTTSQPALKSTTKEAFTTTNKITSTNSTSSSFKSRDYMTTTSSHTPSSLFTTITGSHGGASSLGSHGGAGSSGSLGGASRSGSHGGAGSSVSQGGTSLSRELGSATMAGMHKNPNPSRKQALSI